MMQILKKVGWLIVLAMQLSVTIAQTPFFEKFGVENGLPSNEIYDQIQDKTGYMWFATSKGIARFDGNEFKNYGPDNTTLNLSIIKIFEDRNGRIWFTDFSGRLSYLFNDKIVSHPLNDTIVKIAKNYFIDNIYVDSVNNLWIMPSMGGVYKIYNNTISDFSNRFENKSIKYTVSIKLFNDGFIWNNSEDFSNITENKVIQNNNDIYLSFNDELLSIRRNFLRYRNNHYYFSKGNLLFETINKQLVAQKSFTNDITNIYIDKTNNLWICVLYEGIYMYKQHNLNSTPARYFEGKSPAEVLQDNEGNYWIPTTDNGLYFIPSLQFNMYEEKSINQKSITAIAASDNLLYISTYDKQLLKCKISENKILQSENILLPLKQSPVITDIICDSSTTWFTGDYLIAENNNKIKIIEKLSRAYRLALSSDKNILVGLQGGFSEQNINKVLVKSVNNYPAVTTSIFKSGDGRIWLGTVDGLYSYENNKFQYLGLLNPLLKSRIDDICEFKGTICLATRGNGLIVLKNNSVNRITTTNGLSSNSINCMLNLGDSVLWLGTNKGITKLMVTDNQTFNYKLTTYNHADGLFSEEIIDMVYADNYIWLATSKGLLSFSPHNLKENRVPPKFVIDSLLINDEKRTLSAKYEIWGKRNNVTMHFNSIYFKSPKKVKFRYKLSGFDNNWIVTSDRFVRLASLPPGDYTFYITAQDEYEHWDPNAFKIQFIIRPHFTQTIFFSLLMYFIITAIVVIIIFSYYKNLRNRISVERSLLLSEQKALRSQMNPHFIFNALNSIRSYILENETDTADNYLTNFASLMRKVLDNSKNNTITLQNEIETLKLYLSLEQMRFDETFTFDIVVSPKLNTHEIKIPPMLIQPFLENAIWHGLVMKKSGGMLKLIFTPNNNNELLCIVQDNGIGRNKAKLIHHRRSNHKSTGLENITERINLLNRLYRTHIRLIVKDLQSKENEVQGTRVELYLPYMVFNN